MEQDNGPTNSLGLEQDNGPSNSLGLDIKTLPTAHNRKQLQKVYIDRNTSSEDEEGCKRPKLGAGVCGRGPPPDTFHLGKNRPFHNGSGLCSPGRWPPHNRLLESSGMCARMRMELLRIMFESLNVTKTLATMATSRCTESPFSEERMARGREVLWMKFDARGGADR